MVVALRGYTQGAVVSPGASIAWPAGTVAGDLALVHTGGNVSYLGPQTLGWSPCGHKSWWKILTAADIATALVVNARHVKLQTFTGAASVGRTSSQNGVAIAVVGSGFWLDAARPSSGIAPATYRLGTEWQDENGWWQAAYFAPAENYCFLPGVASGTECYSYELVPLAVPGAPTPLAPSEGEHVTYTDTLTFSWRHESTLPQIGFRLRMAYTDKVSGSPVTLWLTTPGGTPSSATETGIASSSQSTTAQIPSGAAGQTLTWSVATQTTQGWSAYSARSLYADEPPSFTFPVDKVTVTATAGDLTPTVSWAAAANRSGGSSVTLTGWRIRVTPAASSGPDVGTIYDSGTTTDEANGTHTVDLPATAGWTNGQSVKAWVTAYQQGGASTTYASAAFTVSWTPTATPTIAAAVADPPTVTVSGLTSGNAVQVEQQLDGATWTLLASRTATGATLTIASPLALTGAPVSFRARQAGLVDGAPMWSAWSTVATITAPPTGAYLVDDADRSSYLRVYVRQEAERGIVQGLAATYGLGASLPRVDQTPMAGQYGSLVLGVADEAARAALVAWLDTHAVWWMVWPPDARQALPATRVARVSPPSWQRVVQAATTGARDVPLSWVEQPGV